MRSKALSLAIAISFCACGSRKKSREDAAPLKGDTKSVTVGSGAATGSSPAPPDYKLPREMSFELLEAGSGRRVRLRYDLRGAPRELVAHYTVTTRANIEGEWTPETVIAPVSDGFGVSAEPGVIHVRGLDATVGTGAPPAVAAAETFVARWKALVAKRRADVTLDDRGRLDAIALLDDPSGTNVDAREELEQRWLGLAVPLPDEPVGVGARWRVVSAMRAGGIVVKQTANYRLVALDRTWTIEIAAERIGEAQEIVVPGTTQTLGELIAMRRLVTGTIVVGAGDPLPLRGSLTSEVSSHARLGVGGKISERFSEDRATIELAAP